MRYEHRAMHEWPGELLKPWERKNPQFRADWNDTLQLLGRELDAIKGADIVLETAHGDDALRLDGTLKGNAREPAHPGVILSFESKYGPLQYHTDAFPLWRQNVRAIALGLEALRKLERFGITQRGQQYTGWARLGPGTGQMNGAVPAMTADRAREVIAEIMGLHKTALVKAEPDTIREMYRLATKKVHPDKGGAREEWDQLAKAAEVLGIA